MYVLLGKPGNGASFSQASEIPGLPGGSQPTGQPGSPLHVPREPADQSAGQIHSGVIGELRLDGGRLPMSISDEMTPPPSMPVSQQPQVDIGQPRPAMQPGK